MRICKIIGCKDKHYGKGFCKNHYLKDWHKENFDHHKKIMSIYQKKNPKKYAINNKRYHEKYPERRREYESNHPEQRLETMKRHLEKYGKSFSMNPYEYSYALNYWSRTIKKLDNFMCKNCDSTKNLHAHHLMPKNEFPKLSLDLDNGITLCEDCHSGIHGYIISIKNL